jgi:hypothetical protein
MSFEEDELENRSNTIIDENDELLNLALKASLEDIQQSFINTSNDDELLRKAIEASLIENQKQNDDLFKSVLYESLDTVEDDDKILEKVIEESHLSNISIRLNTEIINSGMSRNIDSIMNISNTIDTNTSDDIDTEHNFVNHGYQDEYHDEYHDDYNEEDYMKMIIQQIKESEELETKLKINKNTKSIIEEQDFEYEESLRQDIEKEKEKAKAKEQVKTTTINEVEKHTVTITNEPELPKTKEELRKLRMAFYDKK